MHPNEQTKFLYQPREDVMSKPGQTSVIEVDRKPAYWVLLEVQDACGSIERRQVQLICDDEKTKVNTIFFEKLNRPLIIGKPPGN